MLPKQAAARRLEPDEAELRPFALRKFWNRLAEDDVLEVRCLLMIGERCFACEHLIEEVFSRLGQVLMDLEFLHAGLALRLRQEIFQ